VTDRPTNSHEYILMLTKSAHYYWDMEAGREAQQPSSIARYLAGDSFDKCGTPGDNYPNEKREHPHNFRSDKLLAQSGRNLRSVWTFPTQPYKGAHFATFPEALPERCIKAATPEAGCCPDCGSPWVRVVEKTPCPHTGTTADKLPTGMNGNRIALMRQAAREQGHEYINETKTLGWRPSCQCGKEPVPSIVLDPFAGSGTTLWVAKKLNRRAVGYEISAEYCRLTRSRNAQQVGI